MGKSAETVSVLEQVHSALRGVPTLALIESAAGYAALPSLGGATGVLRLVVGHIDFMADTGLQCDSDESELAPLRFGFSGKLCIHPSQVAVVHDAFRPTAEELAWARKVLAADAEAGGAAVQVDGRMVDLPVVLQARRTLAFAPRA